MYDDYDYDYWYFAMKDMANHIFNMSGFVLKILYLYLLSREPKNQRLKAFLAI